MLKLACFIRINKSAKCACCSGLEPVSISLFLDIGVSMLAELFSRIAKEYSFERARAFTNSPFGNFVRHDVAIEAKKHVLMSPHELTVKASVGQGAWASVPWLAFFDPLVTDSATKGFYVVVLINPQNQTFTLSLNQGTTEVFEEFKTARGLKVLARRARDMADRLPEYAEKFSEAPIDLGSDDRLPAGYVAGHAFGRTYQADSVSEVEFSADLNLMLKAYATLVERGGTTPTDVMQEEAGSESIEETRKYVLSRRIERSPKVRKGVLKAKPPICECCGLNPKNDFGFQGAVEEYPLDVHHAAPLFGLAEGETRRYRIPQDFLVLCPTCHRMMHKQKDVSDLKALKAKLRFKIARIDTFSSF
ncbi:MAG: DUF3578 domain-containing protein [Paracoccus sp. BP8]|nr:MAG: DUF3578 domain-containing protein [Paracoccus sp. BP8]